MEVQIWAENWPETVLLWTRKGNSLMQKLSSSPMKFEIVHIFSIFDVFLIQFFDIIFFQNLHILNFHFYLQGLEPFHRDKSLPGGYISSTGRIPLPQAEYLLHRQNTSSTGRIPLPQAEYLLHRQNTSSTGRIPLPQAESLSHRGTCLPCIESKTK